MKKKGFTLVELLAVIVILAIILVIAVPQIISTINESRKGALISSAKLIASTAESMYLANNTLEIEQTITCEDIAELTPDDYASCNVTIEGGEAKVTIVGKGKFAGMNVCSGTKVSATVTEEECPQPALPGVEQITTLANNTSNTEGLENTPDGNIRYTGSEVKNYVEFNDETWRIVGVFEVTKSNGTKEKLMKIVRDASLGSMSWDSSASAVNGGCGVNEWSEAGLQTMLNTYYLGTGTTCTYCSGSKQSTCTNDCSNVAPINSTYVNMIEEVKWNTGAITWTSVIPVETAYEEERGTTTGKTCTSGSECNDTVERKTEWTGKVGLIYPSDYGYASTDTSCRVNIYDTTNYPCKNSNWLHNNSYYWTLSPDAYFSDAHNVWSVSSSGNVGSQIAVNTYGVRPAVYLKSNVQITGGDGSSSTPYKLSL